jgi:hypothetical protein
MLGAESCQGRRVEGRPEQDQLLEPPCSRPLVAKKDGSDSDRENHSSDEIRPEHHAGNRERSHEVDEFSADP